MKLHELEPIYCECCEERIYRGDIAVKHNSQAGYICYDCYRTSSKKDLVHILGYDFVEVR